MTAQPMVIDFETARKARCQVLTSDASAPDEDRRTDRNARQSRADRIAIKRLARRVSAAMADWGESPPLPADSDLEERLTSMIADIWQSHDLLKEPRDRRLARVLRSELEDARLARVSLLTPQDLLSLPKVGRASLDQLIDELAEHSPLTLPELITGRGKAALQLVETPDIQFELSTIMAPDFLC